MKTLYRVTWISIFLFIWISNLVYAFNDVDFVDSQNGWVVGENIILHTTDGGNTWETQDSGISDSLSVVQFINSKEGWIISNSGSILHTYDSGNTWTVQASVSELWGKEPWELGGNLCIDFVDSDNGWIVGGATSWSFPESILLHTNDGGQSWTVQKSDKMYMDVHFISPTEGWIVGAEVVYEGFEPEIKG